MGVRKIVKLDESQREVLLRFVVERGPDRRQSFLNFVGDEKRKSERRGSFGPELEDYKKEALRLRKKNESLSISLGESVLWYSSLVLGFGVIFGWMSALTVYA